MLLGLLGFGAFGLAHPLAVQAGSPAAGLKVVIIVGPASGSTGDYIQQANVLADQATAEGMRVTKIYTPNAYWSTVKDKAQNANLLVYFGHGNGFPSPYGPVMHEDTQDGFGLNPEGVSHGSTSPTDYHGANDVRAALSLAKNAVVLLYRLCYASGNAESGMRVMNPDSNADRNTAFQRVDNFAAGFLKIGAGAVFSWGWPQKINLPQELAQTNHSVDRIFEEKANGSGYPTAYIGTHDYKVASRRTDGAWLHLDPHPVYGYLRALTGNLEMTAADWRGESAPKDTTPPVVSGLSTTLGSASLTGSDGVAAFSPNGDGLDDRLAVQRTVSESGTLDTSIRDASGSEVKHITEAVDSGAGGTTWDGTDSTGARVPDGLYSLQMTATDRAGNAGSPSGLPVRVLTALSSVDASAAAIDVVDGDPLTSSVRFDAVLSDPNPATNPSADTPWTAATAWSVIDSAGHVVRGGPVDPAAVPGALLWNWDGRNDAGDPVPDGTYRGLITATTDAGTISYARAVYVGPFRYQLSKTVLTRGQQVKITVINTDVLSGPLKLTIRQTGLAPYSVTLNKVSDHRYALRLTLATGGSKGRATFTLSATDTSGNPLSLSFRQTVK